MSTVAKDTPKDGLLRVQVTIGARKYDEDLAAQAQITPDIESMNLALSQHPGRFAEWAKLETLARSQYKEIMNFISNLDADIKEIEARAYLTLIDLPAQPGFKPLTVDAIKANVTIDPGRLALVKKRQDLKREALTAQDALDRLTVGKEVMIERRGSLMALSANWRQEMESLRVTVHNRAVDSRRPITEVPRPPGAPRRQA